MRVSDRFRIGSLTKTYVATVVLQLAGEGKLSLDDSVERWLPGMVPNGQNITLRELLNHHSGLFDFFNDPQHLAPYLNGDFAHVYTPEQLVAIAVAHPPLFPPHANVSYSNTNDVLLGLIIQKITGRSIGAELSRRIFKPLKLPPPSSPPSSVSPARTRTATSSPIRARAWTPPPSAPRTRGRLAPSSPPPMTSPASTGPCCPAACCARTFRAR